MTKDTRIKMPTTVADFGVEKLSNGKYFLYGKRPRAINLLMRDDNKIPMGNTEAEAWQVLIDEVLEICVEEDVEFGIEFLKQY